MMVRNMPLYILSLALAFVITVVLEKITIPRLSTIARQRIYTDGPSWHASKRGTPTMGGMSFVIAYIISLLVACLFLFEKSPRTSLSLITVGASAVANALVGLVEYCDFGGICVFNEV